jgi:hypothetical protein
MLWVEGLLLIIGIGAALLMAGYWLAEPLSAISPAERLAVALLGGLASSLLMVSWINAFMPIRGAGLLICLAPCLATARRGSSRALLLADVRQTFGRWEAKWVILAAGVFLALLLRPLLANPELVFYDGSSNHDNFFYIADADYLAHHSYLGAAVASPTHPFHNSALAFVGWRPTWGRMGAEGLLALASGVTGVAPISLYAYATAALFLPWCAGVYLVLRSFIIDAPPRLHVLLAVVFLQPVFIFFHGNGNLANLIGAILASGILVAAERCTRRIAGEPRGVFWSWWGLLALTAHGLLCSYPEMMPFVMLPCALLWLRAWRREQGTPGLRLAALAIGAVVAGALINPITTARALQGFLHSFDSARTKGWWANHFEGLPLSTYPLGLTSMAISMCERCSPALGGAISLLLIAGLIWTVRRARDSFGTAALLAGAGLLLGYTLLTGFAYGWQKTVQFAGISIGAIFPVGCLATLDLPMATRRGRLAARFLAGSLAVVFACATVRNFAGAYPYAERKAITREMLTLRDRADIRLTSAPVLVVGESFEKSFFYGMWASYLLPRSPLLFSKRVKHPGGYLGERIRIEAPGGAPTPAAVFVSREWAESIDANATRWAEGKKFALLENTNRVLEAKGFRPKNGVPSHCSAHAELSLLPYRDSWLHLTLWLPGGQTAKDARLSVENRLEGELQPHRLDFAGQPPWKILLPLKGGVRNEIVLELVGGVARVEFPCEIDALRIANEP